MRKYATAACLAVLATGSPVAPGRAHAAAWITTSDRAAVIAAYEAEFNRPEVPTSSTGDTKTCNPGTTSAANQASVLQRVNWYRAMAGLGPVTTLTSHIAEAQAAALISAAEGQLSHAPSAGANCYTIAGASGAGHSNLGLGVSGTRSVEGYIADNGGNNKAVGHRSWLLARGLAGVASGDIDETASNAAASAIWVELSGTSSARDGYVAWPPSGYVPDSVVPARWSFTLPPGTPSPDFTSASVTVSGPSGQVPTTIEYTSGWIDPGFVFAPALPTSFTADATYHVAISGVKNAPSSTYSYDVHVVVVDKAPVSRGSTSWGAPSCAAPGSSLYQPNVVDPEGGALSFSLVSGSGSADNALFNISKDGTISAKNELSWSRTSYSVRWEARDSSGLVTSGVQLMKLADASADSSIACPASGVGTTEVDGSTVVSWTAPSGRTIDSWYVTTTPDSGFCYGSTKTSCTLSKLVAGRTYTVNIAPVRAGRMGPSYTLSYTKPTSASPTPPPTPAPVVPKSVKRGSSTPLSSLMTIPKGVKTYSTSGPCRLNAAKTRLIAGKVVGTCSVRIVARVKSPTGKISSKRVTSKISVV